MKMLSLLAVLSTAVGAPLAVADSVTLNLTSGVGTRTGTVAFTFNDAGTGTMSIRITNTTAGTPTFRDISALFWTFSGSAMDIRSGGANAGYSSSSNGGVYSPHSPAPYTAGQMWAFHDPSNDGDVNWATHPAPNGAIQGLGAAGLGLWAGNHSTEVLESGAANQIDGPDGVIVRAGSGASQGGSDRNQFNGWVEFNFNNLSSWYASHGGIRNIRISNASLQFGTDAANPNVGLVQLVPLPTAASAGLASLAGIFLMGRLRRRSLAKA